MRILLASGIVVPTIYELRVMFLLGFGYFKRIETISKLLYIFVGIANIEL